MIKSGFQLNDFILDGGAAVRIYCIDWSEITEKKRNYVDNFSIDVSSQELLFWLSNKAN